MTLPPDLLSLAALDAPPGREDAVRDAVRRAADARGLPTRVDGLGNLIVGPGAPRLALFVPLDEVGFVLHARDEEGFWRVAPLGPIPPEVARYQPVRFLDGGRALLVPTSDASERPDWDHILADPLTPLSLATWGVWDTAPFATEHGAAGKAVGSRALVALMLALWAQDEVPDDVAFVFVARTWARSSGEGPVAFATRPRQALRLRPAPTRDVPPRPPGGLKLGAGPGLALRDENRLADAQLLAWLEDVAQEAGVPWQAFVPTERATTWTSAPRVAEGVPTLTLVLPVRHLATPYERVHAADIQALQQWLRALLAARDRAPYA